MFLESRFNGRFDLLDIAYLVFDQGTRLPIKQGNTSTGARRVARRRYLVEIALGNQAEHHRVLDVDVRPERAGKTNTVDLPGAEMLHEQFGARVQCSFGKLDRPDIVLQDTDRRITIVQDVSHGPAVFDHAF